MRTVLMSTSLALVAAVAAAFIALAIDGDGSPAVVVEKAVSVEEEVSEAQPVSGTLSDEVVGSDEATDDAGETPPGVGEPAVIGVESGASQAGIDFDPVSIFQTVAPSVVGIVTGDGSGTGFFVDANGNIVTNYHVVQGASTVTVELGDGSIVNGTVRGFDNANDLAVVKVDPSGLAITPVRLGDSNGLIVGEPVAAIGHPFALERTLTTGIISATGRTRPPLLDGGRSQRGLIQTDAAVNPGNSGGPLINAAGEVVGVNASAESPVRGSVGTNFAVPVNLVTRFLPAMIAGETVAHPWIGITGQDTPEGALVDSIVAGSPADQTGLQVGDRIQALSGTALDDFEHLAVLVDGFEVGETVTMDVLRDGTAVELELTLGAWPGLAG